MVESIVNYSEGTNWLAYSPGTQPAGYVHPKAVQYCQKLVSSITVSQKVSIINEMHLLTLFSLYAILHQKNAQGSQA